MEEITGNIWPIMRRNIGTFFHWKINQKEKILKYHRQQKVSTERNRTDEINNRITNRHGNELTKRWNRDRDQKKKKKKRKKKKGIFTALLGGQNSGLTGSWGRVSIV